MGVVQLARGGPGLGSPTSLFTGVFVFSLLDCSGFYWWVAVDVCLSHLFVAKAVELDFVKFVGILTRLLIFRWILIGLCPMPLCARYLCALHFTVKEFLYAFWSRLSFDDLL